MPHSFGWSKTAGFSPEYYFLKSWSKINVQDGLLGTKEVIDLLRLDVF